MTTSLADATMLRKVLSWIDSVPSSAPLPAMPGFDRDWFESLIAGQMDGWPELSFKDAVEAALEWVDAVPPEIMAGLLPFERPVLTDRDSSQSFDM